MKIIIVNKDHAQARSITLGAWARAFLSVCLLGIPTFVGAWGYSWLVTEDRMGILGADKVWMDLLSARETEIEEERVASEVQIAALMSKMAELQARLTRLDALGEKLTAAANLEHGEFDFSQPPAYGGASFTPLHVETANSSLEFIDAIDFLSSQIESREQQLNTIDALLEKRSLHDEVSVYGSPVKKSYISSKFGYRKDPFSGKTEFHSGIDFTAKKGSDVLSVAAGVVAWAGRHPEYGNMVEIKHSNGVATRYAHNSSNLVKAGDVIKKGQVIALAGSTGRSTAPHVHFEVYKNGRVVDPSTYIRRTNR